MTRRTTIVPHRALAPPARRSLPPRCKASLTTRALGFAAALECREERSGACSSHIAELALNVAPVRAPRAAAIQPHSLAHRVRSANRASHTRTH